MKFCDRLRENRLSKKLTQEELARKAGITSRMLQKYECGTSMPRVATAQALASALEMDLNVLMGNDCAAVNQITEDFGVKAGRDFIKQAEAFSALMAGGDIPEEDRDAAFKMILAAYSDATKTAREKYTPKKYKK